MEWPNRTAMASHHLDSRSYQGTVDEWTAPGTRIASWTCSHRHHSEAAARAGARRNPHLWLPGLT